MIFKLVSAVASELPPAQMLYVVVFRATFRLS
jgi:hypothetical protein